MIFQIDFVAHDELPYTNGSDVDVYAHIKAKGMFVATERTGNQKKILKGLFIKNKNKSH